MNCTVCGTTINKENYSTIELADVSTLHAMDQEIHSRTPYVNYKLCKECADRAKEMLIDALMAGVHTNCEQILTGAENGTQSN